MKNPVILISLFIIGFIAIVIEWHRQGDFYIFLNAGKLLNQERNIYVLNELSDFKYFYSPLFAVFMSWFSNLSYPVVMAAWKILNMFFLYRVVNLILHKYLNIEELVGKKRTYFYLAFFLSNFFVLFTNFQGLQMSLFLVYAVLEGFFLIRFTRFVFFGAMLIALAINIKVMPVVVLPYLIFRGELKGFVYVVLSCLIFLFIPGLFIGFEYNSFLLTQWWASINPLNAEHVLDISERGLHSVTTLVGTLFSEDRGDLMLRRNITVLSIESIGLIITLFQLVLVSSTLLVFRWTPFKKEKNRIKTFAELSVLLLVTPLIFPHQQSYAFLLIMPAVGYCWYVQFLNNQLSFRNTNFTLLCVSIFIISMPLFFGFAREHFWHYKTLTYGVLLFWFVFLRIYLGDYNRLKKEQTIPPQ